MLESIKGKSYLLWNIIKWYFNEIIYFWNIFLKKSNVLLSMLYLKANFDAKDMVLYFNTWMRSMFVYDRNKSEILCLLSFKHLKFLIPSLNSHFYYVCVCVSHSVLSDFLWPHKLPMGFSRQEYWSGLPFPSPEDLPDPGIRPRSPKLQADSLPSELQGRSQIHYSNGNLFKQVAFQTSCSFFCRKKRLILWLFAWI